MKSAPRGCYSNHDLNTLSFHSLLGCKKSSPNVYSRVSGATAWIQETICKLSDFRANYTFCSSAVCPVDLTLLGEFTLNETLMGWAYVPTVTGSMLTPPQDTVTQSLAPWTFLKPGKLRTVTVVATDSANQITNCTWVLRVPEVEAKSYVSFQAKKRNFAAVQYYSLNVPYSGKFISVYAEIGKTLERKKDAYVKVIVKRETALNLTDSQFLQAFKVTRQVNDRQVVQSACCERECPRPVQLLVQPVL